MRRGNQGDPKAQNEITSQMEAAKVVRKHSDLRDWIKQAARTSEYISRDLRNLRALAANERLRRGGGGKNGEPMKLS